MSAPRSVLVTGANRGIGYAIIKKLASEHPASSFKLLLGARDATRAAEAVASLKKEFPQHDISPLLIDIDSKQSIEDAAAKIRATGAGLDILINNAAIYLGKTSEGGEAEAARKTIHTNYYGNQWVLNAFLPLLNAGGRFVNVSSMLGQSGLTNVSQSLRDQFLRPDLTVDQLDALMNQFVDDVRVGADNAIAKGWGYASDSAAYDISKVGLNMLTRIVARDITKYNNASDVLVNAVCPGWCQTDLAPPNRKMAPLTADQGAETPVHVALLPSGSPSGVFWTNKSVQPFHTKQ